MSFRGSEQDRRYIVNYRLSAAQALIFTSTGPYSNTVTTLIALLKTTSTLLLKLSQQLHLMLTAGDALRVYWLDSLKSSEEKRQWTEHKMGTLAQASEDLLMSSE